MTQGPSYEHTHKDRPKIKIRIAEVDGKEIALLDGDKITFNTSLAWTDNYRQTPKPYQITKGWYNRMTDIDPGTSPEIVYMDPDFLPIDGYNRIVAQVKKRTELMSVEAIIGKGYGDFTPGLCLVMALKELARIPVKHPGEDHKMYLTRAGFYLALVAPRLAEATYRDHQDKILRTAAPKDADAAGQLLTITAHLATLAPKAYVDPRSSYHLADAGYCLTWLAMIPVWDPTSAISEAEIRSGRATYRSNRTDPKTDYLSGGAYTVGSEVTLYLDWDAYGLLGIKDADQEDPRDPADFKGRI